MTQLHPAALEEAAKELDPDAWRSKAPGADDRREDTRIVAAAAITAYLTRVEKDGWVMVRGAGSRHDSYIGLLRSLAECGGTVKLPHPIIRGYGPGYLERHGYAQWLRDSPRSASATGFAITEKGRAMLAAAQNGGEPCK